MSFDKLYQRFSMEKCFVFSLEEACLFFPKEKKSSLKQQLSRWKEKGLITSLRRGLYELNFPSRRALPDMFLANKIVSPSCVSLETALSHYGLIPEFSVAVTSLTTKPTRRFKNNHGLFIYRHVRPEAFCGHTIEKHDGYPVLIAEPEKALVDWWYLKKRRASWTEAATLRLDRKRAGRLNQKKIEIYAGLYGINAKEILNANL